MLNVNEKSALTARQDSQLIEELQDRGYIVMGSSVGEIANKFHQMNDQLAAVTKQRDIAVAALKYYEATSDSNFYAKEAIRQIEGEDQCKSE